MGSRRFVQHPLRAGAAGVATLIVVLSVAAPAWSIPTLFTAGDLVVYETQGTSSASQAVSLVDYSTSGTPSGFVVNLPTTESGSTHYLTESGSALNDGELTDSADGQSLVATGYDAPTGVTKITSATNTPRTVAIVSPTGTVDTSTSLSDANTESQNFRSATTAVTGGSIYTGGGFGAGITSDGGTAVAYLNTDKVHEVQVVDGQLYESTTGNINQVGSGLPTSSGQTDTALLSGTNLPTNFGPDQFALVTLGSGPGPDTLYVADGSNGSSGGPNAVEKYSLESGVWTATGSITVPQAVGLAAQVINGVAHVYVTGATSDTASNNTVLDSITDSSGFGGTLSGTATTIATAPSGTDFKGLALAPVAQPGNQLPEVPVVLFLPAAAALLLGGFYVTGRLRRNRHTTV